MKDTPSPDPALSRRAALRRTLLGGLTLGTGGLAAAAAAPEEIAPKPIDEPFVMENDYPYFGAEPQD